LSCQNDEGSFPPTTVSRSAEGRAVGRWEADAPSGGAAGRSRSATGETLTRRHQRAERVSARSEQDGGRTDDPFDRWVDRQLRALYGPVVDEPVPPRLRALLEQAGRAVDAAAEGRDGTSSDGTADGDSADDGDADRGDDGGGEDGGGEDGGGHDESGR